MSKIRIKNFGPIKMGLIENNGWINISKITIFIGNQGSGKSAVAKLISTFTWMEKALSRGDMKISDFERYNRFRKKHCAYQNIHNYFKDNTYIEYVGKLYSFTYRSGNLKIKTLNNPKYYMPKVMYVPAERNFVSAVSQPDKLKYLPQPLYTFLDEFERSKFEISEPIELPINNLSFKFEKKKKEAKLVGGDYEVILSEASSGLQSFIPLFIVTKNLAEGIGKEFDFTKNKLSLNEKQKLRKQLLEILLDKNLNEDLKKSAIDLLSSLTKNDYFFNIVEEPEQNLFPASQRKIIFSLLKYNNLNKRNKLLMTTHSPYIINYLSIAIEANFIKSKIKNNPNLLQKLDKIITIDSTINAEDVSIYEFDEIEGSVKKLKSYEGIPSDRNLLNESLSMSNEIFSQLLEIDQEI
ncbi:MAG: ATP-binding protein [Bacteroidetes bacterium]|nr:MAG: ATP-binding protein [Bacteroidota bacterium]